MHILKLNLNIKQTMDDQEYISKKINPLIELLMQDILEENPPNIYQFILSWLRNRTVSKPEKEELRKLKSLRERIQRGLDSDSESEDLIDTDESEVEPAILETTKRRGQRTSVSAEVYGAWNPPKEYVPVIVEKTNEQITRILQRLDANLIFASLDQSKKELIAKVMIAKDANAGEEIIKQGDGGNLLYVVDTGKLECFKTSNEEKLFLKYYVPGEAFGELALLYNCPRAASITAIEDSKLWALDRESFNHIVKNAVCERRNKFEEIINKIPLFSCVGYYEKVQLGDVLETASFEDGEYIVREGEWGDIFYIIESGNAIVTKTIYPGLPPVQVLSYKEGDYFGELALIKGEPRAANVIAQGYLKCLTIDRHSFKRLLGSLEDILKSNSEQYKTFISS